MIDDIYDSDNETLRSLGFSFQGNQNNRRSYFLNEGVDGVQVYVTINYGNKTYEAQILKNFITEAVIKPADNLDELLNNIIEGNTQNYWWAADVRAAK